jgi:chromosome segregation ATPase
MSDPRRSSSNRDSTLTSHENVPRAPRRNCEECKNKDEYIRVLKNALREVLDQNEALRSRVAELEALISQSEEELGQKDELISQLQATLKEAESKTSRKLENVKSDEP